MQAGVGMHLIDPIRPRPAALEHISEAQPLEPAQIRRLLGLVRNGRGEPAGAPTPGLADLSRLAHEVTVAVWRYDVRADALPSACHQGSISPPTPSCRRR